MAVAAEPTTEPGREPDSHPSPSFRFDAFVSYSRKDADFARALQGNLEKKFSSLVKRVRGQRQRLTLFRDETDLTASGDLLPALNERIRESRKLLVICSPHSRNAFWIDQEVEGYRSSHGTSGNDGIVAVLLSGDDPVRQTAISAALTDGGREPLAIEFRRDRIEPAQDYAKYSQGDGLLRVLAPLLDLEYPDLKRRHDEYERQRLRWILGVSTALALVFAVLSVISFVNYREADRQRTLAFGNLNDALIGYAVAARLALKAGDLDVAAGDFSYMIDLARSLPIEDTRFAPLWATFAEDMLLLGDGFKAAGRTAQADQSYQVAMRIWDHLIQLAERNSSDAKWAALAQTSIQQVGRPGEIFILSAPRNGEPTALEKWRHGLADVSQRMVDLPMVKQ